jgi:oligoendopeptidase F
MLKNLPTTPEELIAWSWDEAAPHYSDLESRPLKDANVEEWLIDWTHLAEKVEEMYQRLYVATTVNTADEDAKQRMNKFLDSIYPQAMAAEQKLKEKFLASKLEPKGFEIPLRNMRAEADLFREANLPLLSEEKKLMMEFDKIYGEQTVTWEGQEVTLTRLAMNFQQPDRSRREKAWNLKAGRQLADREVINDLWQKFMQVRARIAKNNGMPSFRDYAWVNKLRFDYTPEDCKSFAKAIEQVVVPAATRVYEKRKKALGLDKLRPWDLVDGWYSRPSPPASAPALKPFATMEELKEKAAAIFHKVDPVLGGYFDSTVADGLADLDNRKNKSPGAYCTSYTSLRKPFIFVNAVGVHNDVMTTLHESGHSFHVFETAKLPYIHQLSVPMEFAEVASMGMELLGSPYLTEFYSEADMAYARIEHLEAMLLFWPFMAVVDSFQQWVYENPKDGTDPRLCDAKWAELWERFIPAVDYTGFEEVKATGWHRKLHIHEIPFYYVEYGLAQLGAVQIFGNARKDQEGAVAAYRKALSLGGTVTLPELFEMANAKFAFDVPILEKAVRIMEEAIGEMEKKI